MVRGRPPKKPKLSRVCETCSKPYEVYAWENRGLRFCSRKCWSENRSRIDKLSESNKIAPEQRHCQNCNTPFLVGGVGNKRAWEVYCSRQCAAQHRHLHLPGHQRPHVMTEIDAAWLAGVIDGEGCIAWPRRQNLGSVRLSVYDTHRAFLDQVLSVSGTGKLRTVKRLKQTHTQAYAWDCYGENARLILRQILPRLIVKKEAAEVALGAGEAIEPPMTQRTRSMRGLP